MHEISITRHNHLIDPSLSVWGWEIPVYLFIGGLVAGMMIISGYLLMKGRHKESECACFKSPIIAVILLSIGMLALFLDLEHKFYVWRLYTTFQISSPMSWGAWILILVYPALIANILVMMPEKISVRNKYLLIVSNYIKSKQNSIKSIGSINIFLGALLGMYTGVLLSSLGARPLWNTSILWLLFLLSGLSGAAALVHIYAKHKYERELLAKADNIFITFELFVLLMMFVGLLSSSQVSKSAAYLLLSGSFAPVFWVFVVFIGLIIPLILQSLAVNHKIKHSPIVPSMVIFGGLVLRFIIVQAGQISSY